LKKPVHFYFLQLVGWNLSTSTDFAEVSFAPHTFLCSDRHAKAFFISESITPSRIKVQDGFDLPPDSVGLGIDWDWYMVKSEQL